MIPSRFEVATVLLLLAPLSAGFGLWLIFRGRVLVEPSVNGIVEVVETVVGVLLFALGFPLFFSSLAMFASENDEGAEKWLRWLGKLRPRLGRQSSPSNPGRYRVYSMAILIVVFIEAILLIPGIGEDRVFPLNQFPTLFLSLWYFYAFAIGIAGFVLINYRRLGGYVLSVILAAIAVGTNVPDILGLEPPSPPTFRTSILQLATIPPSIILAYVSLKALKEVDYAEGSAILPGTSTSKTHTWRKARV